MCGEPRVPGVALLSVYHTRILLTTVHCSKKRRVQLYMAITLFFMATTAVYKYIGEIYAIYTAFFNATMFVSAALSPHARN